MSKNKINFLKVETSSRVIHDLTSKFFLTQIKEIIAALGKKTYCIVST